HAALAGGEQLSRVEGEGSQVGARADWPAAVYGADGARGVLDHRDSAWPAKVVHRVKIGWDAGLVDEDHGARARGQARLDRRRRQVLRDLVDVSEYGHGSDIARRVRGRDERERWDDDLVAWADSGGNEGQV